MDNYDMSELGKEIRKLKAEVRRLRIAGAIGAVLGASALLVSAGDLAPSVVEAKGFRLIDDSGEAAGFFGVDDSGIPGIWLGGTAANHMLAVSRDRIGLNHIFASSVLLSGPNHPPRAEITSGFRSLDGSGTIENGHAEILYGSTGEVELQQFLGPLIKNSGATPSTGEHGTLLSGVRVVREEGH